MSVSSGWTVPVLIGLCVGCGLSSIPALFLIIEARDQKIAPDALVRAVYLRGIVRSFDQNNRTLVLDGVSPYSLNEAAPFRFTIHENVPVWQTAVVLGNSVSTTSSKTAVSTDVSVLTDGLPIIIRMGRVPGPFRISSIGVAPQPQQ